MLGPPGFSQPASPSSPVARDPFQRRQSTPGPSKALISLITDWEVSSDATGGASGGRDGIASPSESIVTTATSSYGIPSNPFTSLPEVFDDAAASNAGGMVMGTGSRLCRALRSHVSAVRYRSKTLDRRQLDVWRIDGVITDPKPGISSWSGRFTTIVTDMGRFVGEDGFFTITGSEKSRFEQKLYVSANFETGITMLCLLLPSSSSRGRRN